MNTQNFVTETCQIDGKEISFEVGKLATLATAAVVARLGDSMVLATVVGGGQRDDIDWFPLQVEFQEKLYAGGKIKGSRWIKREGRPSDESILTGRIIDRSIRPLFSDGFKAEVQVVVTPLSADKENDLDVLSVCAVSAALSISGLPWEGPLAGMRVGLDKDGNYIAFPTFEQRKESKLNIVVSSSKEAIVMVEAGANEATEDEVVGALDFAKQKSMIIIEAIERLNQKVGKPKMEIVKPEELSKEIIQEIEKQAEPVINDLLSSESAGKINKEPLYELVNVVQELYPETKKAPIKNHLDKMFKQMARDRVVSTKTRLDGRKLDQIRPLTIEIDLIPRTHGSAMFRRGETQALTLTTLAGPSFAHEIELMDQEITKRYFHHYNMPPFSVGEIGRIGAPSRREIGHGALAERALLPMLPDENEFPYTIRTVSECVTSNGSTSMASVCGSTLSLMAAGVPLKKPVAGIAMGLMVKDEDKGVNGDYVILTDIQGLEDHIGDMDFKVAGTYDGITAIQMDIKVKGLTIDLLRQALKQAKDARVFILDRIKEVIAEPRKTVSTFAPKVEVIQIKPDQIGLVIGGGGATIKKIIEQTETEIDINDEGRVVITGEKLEKIQQAKDWILGMTREITVGETFEHGKVMRIVDFGAFVEVLPGREGLVHVSKMAVGFVKNPSEIVKLGDEVKVRVEEIDEMGRVNLSMLFGDDLVKAQQQRQERSNNRFGNNNRGGRDNDEHRNSDFKRDGFRVKRDFRR